MQSHCLLRISSEPCHADLELCIHSGKQFPRLLYGRSEKSRWAISPYLITPATCEVSEHSRFLIGCFERVVQLNTRAQRGAAGDGFMLADLLQLQNGKKSETAFNTSPFYGRWIQSRDLPRSQRQEEGKENETWGEWRHCHGDLLTWQCLLTSPNLTVLPRGHVQGLRPPSSLIHTLAALWDRLH